MSEVIIPTVIDKDLTSLYWIQDESPTPEQCYETKEIVLQSLRQLSLLKKRIIILLMWGFQPKDVARYLETNEMAITRAKRSFLAQLEANGLEM